MDLAFRCTPSLPFLDSLTLSHSLTHSPSAESSSFCLSLSCADLVISQSRLYCISLIRLRFLQVSRVFVLISGRTKIVKKSGWTCALPDRRRRTLLDTTLTLFKRFPLVHRRREEVWTPSREPEGRPYRRSKISENSSRLSWTRCPTSWRMR